MVGKVHAIQGNTITINPAAGLSCFGCMNQKCQANKRLFTAKNSLNLSLSVGQLVEIEVSRVMLIGQALMTMLPPMLGFIGGFLLVMLLFPESGEPARAAGGVLALFAVAGIIYNIRKRFPSKTDPQVVRVF